MEVFLFFTTMLQKFNFRLPEGDELPSTVGNLSITNEAPPFKIIVEERQ